MKKIILRSGKYKLNEIKSKSQTKQKTIERPYSLEDMWKDDIWEKFWLEWKEINDIEDVMSESFEARTLEETKEECLALKDSIDDFRFIKYSEDLRVENPIFNLIEIKDELDSIKTDYQKLIENHQDIFGRGGIYIEVESLIELYNKTSLIIEEIRNKETLIENDISVLQGLSDDLKKVSDYLDDLGNSIENEIMELLKNDIHDKYVDLLIKYEDFDDPFLIYREMTIVDVSKFINDLRLTDKFWGLEDLAKKHKTLEQFDPSIKKREFPKKSVGYYWTWDKDSAEAYWGEKGQYILLEAKVEKINVDWEGTLYANLYQHIGEEEKEIRLKEGKEIELLSIWTKKVRKGEYENEMKLGIKAIACINSNKKKKKHKKS